MFLRVNDAAGRNDFVPPGGVLFCNYLRLKFLKQIVAVISAFFRSRNFSGRFRAAVNAVNTVNAGSPVISVCVNADAFFNVRAVTAQKPAYYIYYACGESRKSAPVRVEIEAGVNYRNDYSGNDRNGEIYNADFKHVFSDMSVERRTCGEFVLEKPLREPTQNRARGANENARKARATHGGEVDCIGLYRFERLFPYFGIFVDSEKRNRSDRACNRADYTEYVSDFGEDFQYFNDFLNNFE